MKKISLFQFLLLILPIFGFSQIPVLEVPKNSGGYKSTNEVVLHSLDLDVKITGNISTTTATMVFRNNSSRILEGRLTFPLPENVSVSGYALDINGKLRHAVPVEKEKAKEVFETIEKRNVDPGIIEKVEGNNFRTRIYPIPAKGQRTVQISYNTELKTEGNTATYYAPLKYEREIAKFKLNISVFESVSTPKLIEKPDGTFDFEKKGSVWTAFTLKSNYKPLNDLKVTIPKPENYQQTVMQGASGNSYYFLSNVEIPRGEQSKKLPSEIAVVWDNSLSGTKRNHQKELQLLDQYFKMLKNVNVKVYLLSNTFDQGETFSISNGNWQNLKNYLSEVIYDGGTDFSQIKSINTDEILFFSDGISSFGDLDLKWKMPVYTIVAATKANYAQMKYISAKTGGEFLNLNENTEEKEVGKLLTKPLKFLGIKENTAVSDVYPSLPTTVNDGFSVSGILNQNNTTVTLLFGYGNLPSIERKILLDASKQTLTDWNISKFWAQNKIAELEIFNEKNQTEIKNLGKQFGIVTNNTSLMVLESVDDYVRYEIFPPEELKAEYNSRIKNNRTEREKRVNDLMAKSERMIEELKKWHKEDFSSKKTYPKPRTTEVYDENLEMTRSNNSQPVSTLRGQVAGVAVSADTVRTTEIEEVVTVAYGVAREESGDDETHVEKKEKVIKAGKITTIDVKSDKQYMKFFEGKKAQSIYTEYIKQRPNYISTPGYYFDIAQLLFAMKENQLGLKVLSSIADLDLENEEIYKLLAYKLKQAGNHDKQLWITKKVMQWRPFDPQSYRDYALAAEDNGKFQEALDNLYKILNLSYAPELAARDNGIEETLLMEINQLINRNRSKMDVSGINPKLIADLQVNIRVVINWNKDDTDIDLWVTDPSGEKCFYSHKATAIGGRMSDDFTGGFGPEQFLLKDAKKGKYKIETNFYGERQASITGPTAIMAEIFLNYATGQQERQIVVFQNEKKSQVGNGDGILIAEFEF